MIKLLIKKSFFEAWDNLFKFLLINLGFIACLGILVAFPLLFKTAATGIFPILLLPGSLLLHLYTGAVSMLLFKVSDYKALKFSELGEGIKKTWKTSILLTIINTGVLLLLFIALPFYFSRGNNIALLGGGIVLWVGLSWLLSSQLFYPVLIRMNCNLRDLIKKSFLITLDNPKHLFFSLFFSLILLLLSIVLFLILPGISAVLILHQNLLKLLLYKYDWKEQNPDSGNKIPWTEILKDEDEKTGSRTLKGIIFPWKD